VADLRNAPYRSHPTGWFQVAYSWELSPGDVRPVRYFSTDLVLYRTETGEVHVAEAYCPHLGAHIGHGGKVCGENIRCPWHGWEYGPDGVNVRIANTDLVRADTGLAKWQVREIDHLIIVWHDALGRPPQWEFPGVPEFQDPVGFIQPQEHRSGATDYGEHQVTPYIHIENAADVMHFPFVHGAAKPVDIDAWEEITDSYLLVRFKILFGEGKASTRMTPSGPVLGEIENDIYGLGLGIARLKLDGVVLSQLVSVTPVEEDTCRLWSTIAATRDLDDHGQPAERIDLFMDVQVQQLRNDFHIWEHLRYTDAPRYAGIDERLYPRLRRWRDRFYPQDMTPVDASLRAV
jgi:3-ketosteroid 9alpha-monooxygenase subunit A